MCLVAFGGGGGEGELMEVAWVKVETRCFSSISND